MVLSQTATKQQAPLQRISCRAAMHSKHELMSMLHVIAFVNVKYFKSKALTLQTNECCSGGLCLPSQHCPVNATKGGLISPGSQRPPTAPSTLVPKSLLPPQVNPPNNQVTPPPSSNNQRIEQGTIHGMKGSLIFT